LELARDQAQLAALKQKLRRNLTSTPLFDADSFRRGIEKAFVMMREQDAPRSFSVRT
jgi:predicted O-linked N-acetylglucosamine transferase (SPINDLY family)